MDEPYDENAQAGSVEEARADLDLKDDGEEMVDLDFSPLAVRGEQLPPVVEEDDADLPVPVIDQTLIAKLDLGPRDVLAVVACEQIEGVESIAQYSHLLGQALHDSGHDNLVLVFPHGTKLKKVTLDDQQMARLRRQVGEDGEEEAPVMRSQWAGFDRQ